MVIFIGITVANISGTPFPYTSTVSLEASANPDSKYRTGRPPGGVDPDGCYYSGIFSISAFFWLPALVYEPILCLMVLWKAWGQEWSIRFGIKRRGIGLSATSMSSNQGRLVRVLARDRYVVLCFLSAIST